MGDYVNPIDNSFANNVLDPLYVDKTGLIEYTNSKINITSACRICNSRPRRFGKTYTAAMLEYYYCKSFDADPVLSQLEISKSPSYREHLNKYNVIHLDIQTCASRAGGYGNISKYLKRVLLDELREIFPGKIKDDVNDVAQALVRTGEKFIFIIDEWDAVIRDEYTTPEIVNEYMAFMRSLFKSSDTMRFLSLAYITGILPVKRVNGESALNEFVEYTMTSPSRLAKYVGFTEDEVRQLCIKHGMDFEQMKSWYDGYTLCGYHVYNPRSVNVAIQCGICINYWTQTGSFESIVPYLDTNFDGLKTAILKMLSGIEVEVNTVSFTNDSSEIKSKDDVLTYLIHLGYLSYDVQTGLACVPNNEISEVLINACSEAKGSGLSDMIKNSDKLLDATLQMNGVTVGRLLDNYHDEEASVLEYNHELALSYVVSSAYVSSRKYYHKPIREMPVGKGYADLIYLPRAECRSKYPALLIELKWDKTPDIAVKQIRERRYAESLSEYASNIILIGINYNKTAKNHECIIEKFDINAIYKLNPVKVQAITALHATKMSISDIRKATGASIDQICECLGYVKIDGYWFDPNIVPPSAHDNTEWYIRSNFEMCKQDGVKAD